MMSIKQTHLKELLAVACCLCLVACEGSYNKLSEERSQKSEKGRGDIVVGIVTSQSYAGLFAEGVRLAADEINENDGIFGRKIRLVVRDDQGHVDQGQKIARRLVKNTDIIAVIGHIQSEVALAVSMIYEAGGLLFISPGATDPRLTRQKDAKYTFRNIPPDNIIIQEMAGYCKRQGIRKLLIIYDRTENTRRQAKMFAEAAKSLSMEIVATRSYFRWQEDYQAMALDLNRNYVFDAVFLAGRLPSAGYVIEQMREMGCEAPFFAMPDLDSPELGGIIGRAAEGTVVPTVFDPKTLSKTTREFVKRFEKTYDVAPDAMAAQGYDALKVLAYAIIKKGSTTPLVMASSLHFISDWHGVTGNYSFLINGDIKGKSIYFKRFINGSFEYISHEPSDENADPNYVIEDIALRIPIRQDPPTIDPGLAQGAEANELTEQLFLGLTAIDPQSNQPVAELARNWDVSEEGTRYRFYLRQDLQWSDRQPITAQDVVWAVRRNLEPQTQSPNAGAMMVLKNADAFHQGRLKNPQDLGVKAIDDYTVAFTLERRTVFFPELVALNVFKPLPRKTIEKFGADWTAPDRIVTNGPYRLAFRKKEKRLVLRKNPYFFNSRAVSIPELHYYVIPEPSVGLAMYQNHELDIMGGSYLNIPKQLLNEIKHNPAFARTYATWPQMSTQALVFNLAHSVTKALAVRKAIASVIDRDLIVSLITLAGNDPAVSFIPPTVNDAPFNNPNQGVPFDPERGRQWLAEAGYPNGDGFPELCLPYLKSDDNAKLAGAIKDLAAHYLNIKIKPVEMNWDAYTDLLKSPQSAPMVLIQWQADYPEAYAFLYNLFHPRGAYHFSNWSDREFLDLIEAAQGELSPDRRKDMYTEAERLLVTENSILTPIYYGRYHIFVNPRVKDWQIAPFGGQTIMNWRLEN